MILGMNNVMLLALECRDKRLPSAQCLLSQLSLCESPSYLFALNKTIFWYRCAFLCNARI